MEEGDDCFLIGHGAVVGGEGCSLIGLGVDVGKLGTLVTRLLKKNI